VEAPVYAVCEECEFLRAFSRANGARRAPDRCPACGREVRVHGRRERFPSAYVSRISRALHGVPPLTG
jgi:hypothetical protein